MPIRLPLDSLLVPVRRSASALGARALARHACVILLLPPQPAPRDFEGVPHAATLRELYAARVRKAGDSAQLRVGERAETLVVMAAVAQSASAFARLSAAAKIAAAALECEPRSLLLLARGLSGEVADAALEAALAALQAAAFRLWTAKRAPQPRPRLERIELRQPRPPAGLECTLAAAAGNNLARWLAALPPNQLDAAGYRRLLREFARALGLGFTFYGERELRRLGAGAFLAVSQGNATRDAGIARLTYRPRGARGSALALVGKGICFDTGGTNLKPHKSMLDMHTDMKGSAVALGTLHALATLGSRRAVDCWLAITENRIGPRAYKPQDVVRARNGVTIQVIHTDAEGRMVLADALSLAAERKPAAIVDFATLTGACVYALTERYSGAFTNRPETRTAIEAAGAASGERVWCFPMDEDFDTDIESAVADVAQCAVEGKGDHILAARFLNRFVPAQIPWLHVDLSSGTRHGGLGHVGTEVTGFGVRFTLELLERGWPAADRTR